MIFEKKSFSAHPTGHPPGAEDTSVRDGGQRMCMVGVPGDVVSSRMAGPPPMSPFSGGPKMALVGKDSSKLFPKTLQYFHTPYIEDSGCRRVILLPSGVGRPWRRGCLQHPAAVGPVARKPPLAVRTGW